MLSDISSILLKDETLVFLSVSLDVYKRQPVNSCAPGGAKAAAAIAEVMGVVAEETEPMVAFVKCGGTCDKAQNKYEYDGIDDCIMASQDVYKRQLLCFPE